MGLKPSVGGGDKASKGGFKGHSSLFPLPESCIILNAWQSIFACNFAH